MKTSLLQAVSHDLSTPLTAIALHLEALRRHATGRGELHDTVVAIADETARLRRRIDNLLAMGRLEAGRIAPRPEPTPPADLFRAVRENLPLVFARRTVAVRVDEACPDAEVDPSLALEILVNLVENAHRAAPAGTSIELRAERHPADPSLIRLEVLDRGPGVAADAVRSLGERRDARASGDATAGSGLEIAHSFARASRGDAQPLRRPEGGTIARLELPSILRNP
jgi:two-component system sensor histidine kinase KdpD